VLDRQEKPCTPQKAQPLGRSLIIEKEAAVGREPQNSSIVPETSIQRPTLHYLVFADPYLPCTYQHSSLSQAW
jgi:hypothetical protein